MTHARTVRIGADVGGTFTDLVLLDDQGRLHTHKVPSTPPDFEQAVLRAVAHLLAATATPGPSVAEVAHGTTVATNAVLEHRGARTALLTTRGFRDVLELRRIRAPQMYDLFWDKPSPLVERYVRFEVTERLAADGAVLIPLDLAELAELADRLAAEDVASVAVCFLHAYAYPDHEQAVGAFLRERLPHLHISLSSSILPERREYERTATTVVNAYVQPIMRDYLNHMRHGLRTLGVDAPLLIMQSAGGLTPEDDAAVRPVFVLESGPAAGVLAAGYLARETGVSNVITLDIGGTTAKASLIEGGRIAYSAEYEVGASLSAGNRLVGGGGELIRAPSIDIAEVGAGGGSIAYLDRAGGLRVGPRSAGAVPGPACYGRGGAQPTVTDANVVLGYMPSGRLADGGVHVDLEAARRAVHDHIARPLGLDLLQAAEGIHRIANARTMRALRAVSTERGRDPRDFTLTVFGGAGPVHGAGLARDLGIRQTVVPIWPGLFSALGLLISGVEHHRVRSCLLSGPALGPEALQAIHTDLHRDLLAQFDAEGFTPAEVVVQAAVDVRYQGQASEIRLPLGSETPADVAATYGAADIDALRAAFAAEHERLYGHRSAPGVQVEAIAFRLIGRVPAPAAALGVRQTGAPALPTGASGRTRAAYFGGPWGLVDTPIVARADLAERRCGPLLVDEYDSTTVVPPDMSARLDAHGSIVIEATHATD